MRGEESPILCGSLHLRIPPCRILSLDRPPPSTRYQTARWTLAATATLVAAMVETRGQQAAREEKKDEKKGPNGLTKDTSNREPPNLEPELGTALAIVVPFMAILLGLFAHKLGLIYIPGVDPWLDKILGALPQQPKRSRNI